MSKRWTSPKIAAKHAAIAEKKSQKLRKENRNREVLLIVWGVVLISITVTDYFWVSARNQRRIEQHQRMSHLTGNTNADVSVNSNKMKIGK